MVVTLAGFLTYPSFETPSRKDLQWHIVSNSQGITAAGTVAAFHGIPFPMTSAKITGNLIACFLFRETFYILFVIKLSVLGNLFIKSKIRVFQNR